MMKAYKWVSTVSVLAMSLFLWSCDNVADPIQPGVGPRGMVVTSTTGQRFTVAVEKDPAAGSVSATIGQAGGKLVLGDHTLLVSGGAVAQPTLFTMSRNIEEPLRVKLTAGVGSENDVGAAGFAAPVTVSMSFQDVAELPAEISSVTGIYFRPDGLVETLSSNVDVTGHRASFDVPHFSLFGLAWP